MGLGSYPLTSLAKARKKATEYRSLLAKGVDPLALKQAAAKGIRATDPNGIYSERAIRWRRGNV
jgi:Arm DNA-binding domain